MPDTTQADVSRKPEDPLSTLSDIGQNSCLMAIDSLLAMLPRDLQASDDAGPGNYGSTAKPGIYPLSFMATAAAQIADCMITTTRDFQAAITDSASPGAAPLRQSGRVA